jgi:hypothetical protein
MLHRNRATGTDQLTCRIFRHDRYSTSLKHRRRALLIGALGVVYGDIGTSPLYALRQSLMAYGDAGASAVLAAVSMIGWSLVPRCHRQIRALDRCAPTTAAKAASSR